MSDATAAAPTADASSASASAPTTASSSSTAASSPDGAHAAATLAADDAASDDGEVAEAADDAAAPVNPLSDSESDSEAEGDAADDDVQLGFLEEPEHPRSMLRAYFPAKVGGKPAWLNPKLLPSTSQLTCVHCSNPMVFLMQLYAPLRETFGAHAGSFHRTLFLFVCLEEKCSTLQRSVLCFRSQLPRHNPFYPPEAPPKLPIYELEKGEQSMPVLEDPAEAGVHLCCVCGNPAPSSCSRCHSRRYCSKLHQLFDWKQGKHKSMCVPKGSADSTAAASSAAAAAAAASSPAASPSLLFPQKEVVIEPENSDDDESDDDESAAKPSGSTGSDGKKQKKQKSGKGDDYSKEHKLLDAYKASKASEPADGEDDDDVEETVANWSSPKLKDPVFNRFKARTARHPEQVLRYDRAPDADTMHTHQPLWVSTWFQPGSAPLPASALAPAVAGQPAPPRPKPVAPTRAQNDAAIPACGSCGGERRFEFQVLPQLLYYLGPLGSSLDFANLAVYTCARSCGEGRTEDGYKEEFVWVQAHAQ